MSLWQSYEERANVSGGTRREAALRRERRMLDSKIRDNLSYQQIVYFANTDTYNIDTDNKGNAVPIEAAIVNSDALTEKYIYAAPDTGIGLGSLVLWSNAHWILYKIDARDEIYIKGVLIQCNHLLKWISPEKEIMSQWCYTEDGTTYLTGEYEDKYFATTRGDSRIACILSKNKYVDLFNRQSRFLIDDDDTVHKQAFQLTKPLKKGYAYEGVGSYRFVMQEVTATEYDNHELGIADYYKYFPKDGQDDSVDDDSGTQDMTEEETAGTGRVWL